MTHNDKQETTKRFIEYQKIWNSRAYIHIFGLTNCLKVNITAWSLGKSDYVGLVNSIDQIFIDPRKCSIAYNSQFRVPSQIICRFLEPLR